MDSIPARLLIGLKLAILGALPFHAHATDYELESCQFISTIIDSWQQSLPPGLDEPLNCDHKCFYDELGLTLLGDRQPNLRDMYSIGWRLLDIVRTTYEGQIVWTVYLEREVRGPANECNETYAPKHPTASDDESHS